MTGRFSTGTLVAVAVVAAVVFAVGATLLIGDNGESSGNGDGTVSATPVPTSPGGDEPIAATPGAPGAAPTTPADPTPLPPDRERFDAPIESVDVLVRESFPPQYAVQIVAGLPSGCAEPAGHELDRDGETFKIRVFDSRPTGAVVCTAIYGYYELTVELGSDLVSGTTYTVDVNGTVETFVAQ